MKIIPPPDSSRGSASRCPLRLRVRALLGAAAVATFFAPLEWQRPGTASATVPPEATPINPVGQLVRSTLDGALITGRVEQRLPAGPYTYLAVHTKEDRLVWAVTLGDGAATGATVKVRSMGRRTDFYSERLQRTFPELVFGIVSQLD